MEYTNSFDEITGDNPDRYEFSRIRNLRCFVEGYRAFLLHNDCPYPHHSDQRSSWERGFNQASTDLENN